jgi:TIR domain
MEVARRYGDQALRSGGILIVADVESNELRRRDAHYQKAATFFKAHRANYGSGSPIYGADKRRYWEHHRQILCDPAKMFISEWIRPVYEGIPEILVSDPICLVASETVVASGNSDSTGTLCLDVWVDEISSCPFAAAAQVGDGFAVLIAGLVSNDVWLKGCSHNSIWLTNLAAFLVDTAEANRARRQSRFRSPHLLFLSHRSTDERIVSAIAKSITRRGVNIWFAEERLVPGQSLIAEINQALGKMTHFVLLWSLACVGAAWVERELNAALTLLIERHIPLIIVRLDRTPVPEIIGDLVRIEAIGESEDAVGARIVATIDRLASP